MNNAEVRAIYGLSGLAMLICALMGLSVFIALLGPRDAPDDNRPSSLQHVPEMPPELIEPR